MGDDALVAQYGVKALPSTTFSNGADIYDNCARVCFSNAPKEQMQEGGRRLAAMFAALTRQADDQ